MKNNKIKIKILCLFTTLALCIIPLSINGVKNVDASNVSNTNPDTINNLVVFAHFNDELEFLSPELFQKYDLMYNTSSISVNKYFKEISENKLNLTTSFFGTTKLANVPQNTYASINLKNPRAYYQKKTDTNRLGYTETVNGKTHIDAIYREQMLMREVVESLNVPSTLSLDNNHDGFIDSFTLILGGKSEEWADLLWPHMTSAVDFTTADLNELYIPSNFWGKNNVNMPKGVPAINGVKLGTYDFVPQGHLFAVEGLINYPLNGNVVKLGNIGIICHELMHTLGAPDLYHYREEYSDKMPVGELDIMESTSKVPQYPLSYQRLRMGWLSEEENIIRANEGGTYTLFPTKSDKKAKALKIKLPYAGNEYFMIEVRHKATDGFESGLSGSGLIVYRIDENAGLIDENGKDITQEECGGMYSLGNMLGKPDEVFVYRNNDASKITRANSAYLGGEGKNSFGTSANNKIYYQGRTSGAGLPYQKKDSEITLKNIKINLDNSVTFDLALPTDSNKADFVDNYPKIVDYTETGASILMKSTKPGTGYYLILTKGSEAPTESEIKSGLYSRVVNGVTISSVQSGKIELLHLGEEYRQELTNLATKSGYDVYFLFEDLNGNISNRTKRTFYTEKVKEPEPETRGCNLFGLDSSVTLIAGLTVLASVSILLMKK